MRMCMRGPLPRCSPRLAAWPWLLLLFLSAPAFAQSAGEIHYLYDALNRLVGVVDPQGNVATYEYDAVGNLLRITRIDVGQLPDPVAISLVIPDHGRVGTPVEIFGKGFSATPSANSIAFNGTSASVLEASPNRLLTAVPAGATTGPIVVTTPLGTATSPTIFTVIGEITVSPSTATVFLTKTQQFEARENGVPTTNVNWSVNGTVGGDSTVGPISAQGLYTAPSAVPPGGTVTVTATHKDDPTLSASAKVTILEPISIFMAAANVSVGIAPPPSSTVDKNVTASVSVALFAPPSSTVDKNVTASVSVAIFAPPSSAVDKNVTASVSVAIFAPPSSTVDNNVVASVSVALQPVITSVSPATAAPGTSNLPITILGSGFTGATALSFLLNNAVDANITVSNLVVNADGTQATANISVAAGAATGARVVRITTPAGSSTAAGTGGNLFTVQ